MNAERIEEVRKIAAARRRVHLCPECLSPNVDIDTTVDPNTDQTGDWGKLWCSNGCSDGFREWITLDDGTNTPCDCDHGMVYGEGLHDPDEDPPSMPCPFHGPEPVNAGPKLYDISATPDSQCGSCFRGFVLAHTDDERGTCIQRCDECGIFESDGDAAEACWNLARGATVAELAMRLNDCVTQYERAPDSMHAIIAICRDILERRGLREPSTSPKPGPTLEEWREESGVFDDECNTLAEKLNREEDRVAALLTLVRNLSDCLTESHEDEVKAGHYGDGPSCSYCLTLKEAAEVLA